MKLTKLDLNETILPSDFFHANGKQKSSKSVDSKPSTANLDDPEISDRNKGDEKNQLRGLSDEEVEETEIKKIVSDFISKLIEKEKGEMKIKQDETYIYILNGETPFLKFNRNVKLNGETIEIFYIIYSKNDSVFDIEEKMDEFERNQKHDVRFISEKPNAII